MATRTSFVAFVLLVARLSSVAAQCADPPPELADIASRYPPQGQVADILPNDADALALYNELLADTSIASLLAVAPKPVTGANYPAEDPDCWWTRSQCVTPKHPELEDDLYTCQEPRTWGLTFDDGPYCGQRPLLDFLQQQRTQGTFFLIGGNVVAFPSEAIDIFERGHEICTHTYSHRPMTSLSNRQAFAELYYSKKAVKEVIGITTRCWRPAYGDIDDRIRAIGSFLDTRAVIWDQDTDDWQIDNGQGPQVIRNFQTIIGSANGNTGTMVLDHSISDAVINTFIQQFPAIRAAFQNVVPGLTCNNWTTPYAETNITYPNFAAYVSGTRPTFNATSEPLLSGRKLLLGNISNPGTPSASVVPSASATASASISASSAASGARATGSATMLELKFSAVLLAAGGMFWALMR